jgi:hypothetical protein
LKDLKVQPVHAVELYDVLHSIFPSLLLDDGVLAVRAGC